MTEHAGGNGENRIYEPGSGVQPLMGEVYMPPAWGQPWWTETGVTTARPTHLTDRLALQLGRLLCSVGRHRWLQRNLNHARKTPGFPFIEYGWIEIWRVCGRLGCPKRQRQQFGGRWADR